MLLIKIGGGKNINLDQITSDIALLKQEVIIVHGGNYLMDELGKKLGVEKKMLNLKTGLKSRYTSKDVIDLLLMSYAGLINKKIVSNLQRKGVNALGLTGIDGRLMVGKRHPGMIILEAGRKKVIKDDLTGSLTSINSKLLKGLIKLGLTLVLTPPVITEEGEIINVDGDKILTKLATELNVKKVILLIEAPGILKSLEDENSVIKNLKRENLENLLETVSGRMKRKILECKKLLDFGVKEIILSDGRVKNPITNALKGGGTHVN